MRLKNLSCNHLQMILQSLAFHKQSTIEKIKVKWEKVEEFPNFNESSGPFFRKINLEEGEGGRRRDPHVSLHTSSKQYLSTFLS